MSNLFSSLSFFFHVFAIAAVLHALFCVSSTLSRSCSARCPQLRPAELLLATDTCIVLLRAPRYRHHTVSDLRAAAATLARPVASHCSRSAEHCESVLVTCQRARRSIKHFGTLSLVLLNCAARISRYHVYVRDVRAQEDQTRFFASIFLGACCCALYTARQSRPLFLLISPVNLSHSVIDS